MTDIYTLADPGGGGGGGGGVQGVSGGLNPTPTPLEKYCKGVQPKVQNYFLTVVLNLQEMHSIFTKNQKLIFFSRGACPPTPFVIICLM